MEPITRSVHTAQWQEGQVALGGGLIFGLLVSELINILAQLLKRKGQAYDLKFHGTD